ncbi:DUF2188 domain-containing protein [Leifsonia shinshuensis]
MPKGDVETYHADGEWKNRIEGETTKIGGTYGTKDEAVRAGRDEAQRRSVEHIIRNLDGTIGERNSYGNDPRNIPG